MSQNPDTETTSFFRDLLGFTYLLYFMPSILYTITRAVKLYYATSILKKER